MVRVRFAASPSGSLDLGTALGAVAGRRFADERGGVLLLRIDDTDPSRNVPGGEEAILADLDWLGVHWDEGPLRQSERHFRYRAAARALRFGTDGPPADQLAAAVDDLDFGITHVLGGQNEEMQASVIRALGGRPPAYIHHGRLLGASSLAGLRDSGLPAEAVRAYLEELGLPPDDVEFDPARLRRRSIEALAALSDEELAARVGVPVSVAPAMRGSRDLREARRYADQVLEPERVAVDSPETLARLRELVEGGLDARGIVRELQAVGGDLKAVRRALTGRDRGPELASVIESLSHDELLSRLEP
jgi:glutamyl/glutaminyl-tRNA synthetase